MWRFLILKSPRLLFSDINGFTSCKGELTMKQKNNVFVFILITFGFSWLSWIPEALIAQGWVAPVFVRNFVDLNLGAWGPLIGAIVTTFIYQKGVGVKELIQRGIKVRLGKWWWVALLIFPVLIGGSLGLALLFGSPTPDFPAVTEASATGTPLPVYLLIAFVFIFFLGGPLQEEFGWRGYAFEHLRNKYNAMIAATLAGLMWGFWHLPLFFVPRAEDYYNRPLWGLLLTTLLVGIILAWIYANTKGSVFAVMLGHTMFNWSNWVFPALKSDSAALILFGLYFLAVGYILWQYGIKTLTKS
jgi:membrane protease YdiL (CAAX protease family)